MRSILGWSAMAACAFGAIVFRSTTGDASTPSGGGLGWQGRVVVCAGSDRVLRIEPTGRCPAGTTAYTVGVAVGPGTAPDKAADDAGPQIRDLKDRVASLEHELDALRADRGRVGTRVVAPFEVDDAQGKAIFAVGAKPRGFELRSASGIALAAGLADPERGAYFTMQDEKQSNRVAIGVSPNSTPQVALRQAGQRRVLLSISDMGEPSLQLRTPNDVPTVILKLGPTGNGLLQLADGAGDTKVEAGTTKSGTGIVRVYPSTCPAGGGLFAPTCIQGQRMGK